MNDTPTGIDELVAELEQTARRLRDGQLEQGEAAALVERCAELAGNVGSQLEREARAAAGGSSPGQEQLL
jgi:hypothetical protein